MHASSLVAITFFLYVMYVRPATMPGLVRRKAPALGICHWRGRTHCRVESIACEVGWWIHCRGTALFHAFLESVGLVSIVDEGYLPPGGPLPCLGWRLQALCVRPPSTRVCGRLLVYQLHTVSTVFFRASSPSQGFFPHHGVGGCTRWGSSPRIPA